MLILPKHSGFRGVSMNLKLKLLFIFIYSFSSYVNAEVVIEEAGIHLIEYIPITGLPSDKILSFTSSKSGNTIIAFERFPSFMFAKSGMWISNDSGLTWSKNKGNVGAWYELMADPTNESHFIGQNNRKLKQSFDSGQTWSTIDTTCEFFVPEFTRVEIVPRGDSSQYIFYGGRYTDFDGLHISKDNGITCSKSKIGMPGGGSVHIGLNIFIFHRQIICDDVSIGTTISNNIKL